MYVADTHAFLWYLADSPKLSSASRKAFDLSEKGAAIIIIPAIVLLECISILDKKKVVFKFEDIILRITQASNFIISELNLGLILEVNKTKGLKDLHDRVIVATAKLSDAVLISRDGEIKNLYPKTIW